MRERRRRGAHRGELVGGWRSAALAAWAPPARPAEAAPPEPSPLAARRSVDRGSPISLIAGACALSAPGAKCKMWRLTEEACPFVKSVVYT